MIEVAASPGRRFGMAPSRFLAEYWQKRPLLIRAAFADQSNPLPAEQLAGLACESDIHARLVTHQRRGDRYRLEHGPFNEDRFAALGRRDWTLLVQDADKWLPDTVGRWLDAFSFVPSWRIDDIMISFAVPGGSVGPHVDQYDVFLLQMEGRREWMIDDRPGASNRQRDDSELRLLREFEPNRRAVLAPGDMLYLPPGCPHHGVAMDRCLTWSIGMRAPSLVELMAAVADGIAERSSEDQRYSDPDLTPARNRAEFSDASLRRFRDTLTRALEDDAALAEVLGQFLSGYRSRFAASPRARPLSEKAFDKRLQGSSGLLRNPWSRLVWRRRGRAALIWLGGDRHQASAELARLLECADGLSAEAMAELPSDDRAALRTMFNQGHLEWSQ